MVGKSEKLLLVLLWLFADSCQGNTDIVSIICLQAPSLWFCKPPAKELAEIVRPIPPPVPFEPSGRIRRLKAERILRDTVEERSMLRALERMKNAELAHQEINWWKKNVVDRPDFWKPFVPRSTASYPRKASDSLIPFLGRSLVPNRDNEPTYQKEAETDSSNFLLLNVPEMTFEPTMDNLEKLPYPLLIQDYCTIYELHFRTHCIENVNNSENFLKKIYTFCIDYENMCIQQTF